MGQTNFGVHHAWLRLRWRNGLSGGIFPAMTDSRASRSFRPPPPDSAHRPLVHRAQTPTPGSESGRRPCPECCDDRSSKPSGAASLLSTKGLSVGTEPVVVQPHHFAQVSIQILGLLTNQVAIQLYRRIAAVPNGNQQGANRVSQVNREPKCWVSYFWRLTVKMVPDSAEKNASKLGSRYSVRLLWLSPGCIGQINQAIILEVGMEGDIQQSSLAAGQH